MTGVSGRRWRLRGRFPDGELAGAPYQPLVRHLLWHRGFRDISVAQSFFEARDPGHDPADLPDVVVAVERLRAAIRAGELIAVYGDFDVDGVTASAILIEAMSRAGRPRHAVHSGPLRRGLRREHRGDRVAGSAGRLGDRHRGLRHQLRRRDRASADAWRRHDHRRPPHRPAGAARRPSPSSTRSASTPSTRRTNSRLAALRCE